MKIVHIGQDFNAGFGYQDNLLPKYHMQLGHDVIYIASTLNSGFDVERGVPPGDYAENGFTVRRIPIYGEFRRRFVLFKGLYAQLEREAPDYIFHHSATSPSIMTVCRYKKKHPEVFLALDNHADLTISGRVFWWKIFYYNLFWKIFLKPLTRYVDVFFGVTPGRCLFLHEELGITWNKIRLLPIGAESMDEVGLMPPKEELFARLKLDISKKTIVHGGKITPEKQCDRLLMAFSQIPGDDWQLALFGRIKDSRVAALIPRDARIKKVGWLNRPDTLSLLGHADLGVWNTQHTTLLEDGVAAGLPMILRYYGGTCHLMRDSGLFLYEGSVREIRDRLGFLMHNPDVLARFRENAALHFKKLSYREVAAESLKYREARGEILPIHQELTSAEYVDLDYPEFKKLRKRHA